MRKMVDGPRGGKLNRGGRRTTDKGLLSRTFAEFARATLEDPEVRRKIRTRLMDELAGRAKNPLPCLAVLSAAATKDRSELETPRAVVFVAEIVGGRGQITRLEMAEEGDRPALPAAPEG